MDIETASGSLREFARLPHPLKGKYVWLSHIGPYRHLFAGTYRFKMKLGGNAPRDLSPDVAIAVLEVVSQRNYLGHRIITLSDLAKGEIELDVDVTEQQSISPGFSIQTLLRTLSPVDLGCSELTCERVSDLRICNDFVAVARAHSEGNGCRFCGLARSHAKERTYILRFDEAGHRLLWSLISDCLKASTR